MLSANLRNCILYYGFMCDQVSGLSGFWHVFKGSFLSPCWLIFLSFTQIALEELAEKVNGDMRMAVNQLQYMSLSMSVIKYDDVRQRLLSSAKDEDISPFTAVDKYGSNIFIFGSGFLHLAVYWFACLLLLFAVLCFLIDLCIKIL